MQVLGKNSQKELGGAEGKKEKTESEKSSQRQKEKALLARQINIYVL